MSKDLTKATNNVPAIEFRHVSLSFDEKQVLSDISFKLERGEMIFITGVSGSGKSVLLRLAMALDRPDSGQILIEGKDVELLDESQLLDLRGNRMGIVFQEDSLFTGLSVFENVAYRLNEHGVPEAETENAVMEVLRFVGLEQDAEKLPAELSGGMRRRLEIARALIGWPSIMLFDEPASGLDPLTAIQVLDLIVRARDVYGISSIYVTKKLDEIPYLASHRAKRSADSVTIEEAVGERTPQTRVLVLDGGRIVFTGSVAEFAASTLPAVTRLTRAENETVFSDFATSDPWDKRRQPRETILGHRPDSMIKRENNMKILIGVDGSPYSDAALEEVSQRTWPKGSEILIVHGYEMPLAPAPEVWVLSADYYERLDRAMRTQSDEIIEAALTKLKAAFGDSLKIQGKAIMGSAKGVILDEAESFKPDLIVVGSHGYPTWERLLLGSVSQAVVSHAKCSVEVVRLSEAKQAAA